MSDFEYFIDDAPAATPARPQSICVAFLKGMADTAAHDEFQKAMEQAIAHSARSVVLDIRNLTFLTSLAVGEIIKLYHAKKSAGGKVVIAGPNQYVEGVFKVGRLGSVVSIVPTVEEGLAACAAG